MNKVEIDSPRGGEALPPNKHQVRTARTKQKIMDAAEPLFAPHGLTGVSMRQIAKEADVDLSLLSYHFDSKQALYNSVVNRIILEFAERRSAALDSLLESNPKPTVLDLFDIQIDAWLDIGFENKDHRAQLILNNFYNSDDEDREVRPSDKFVCRLISEIENALPDKEREFVHWAYHCLMGMLIFSITNLSRIDRISGSYCDTRSREAVKKAFQRQASMAFGLE